MTPIDKKRQEAMDAKPSPKFKKGDKVKHRTFKSIKEVGTITEVHDPDWMPFLTCHTIWSEPEYSVQWGDDPGNYGRIREDQLILWSRKDTMKVYIVMIDGVLQHRGVFYNRDKAAEFAWFPENYNWKDYSMLGTPNDPCKMWTYVDEKWGTQQIVEMEVR